MAKREPENTNKKDPIESYDHEDKKRANNPPVGLVTPETDPHAGYGTGQFLAADLMELPLINRYGNVNEIAAAFGDKHNPVEAIQRLRALAHPA